MMLLLVAATFAAYVAFEFVQMARSGRHGHIWPWLVIFGLGVAIQVMFELHINVPSPATPITNFISGLFTLE